MTETASLSVLPSQPIEPEKVDESVDEINQPDVLEMYAKWRSIPSLVRNPPREKSGNVPTPEEFATSLGFDDDQFFELLDIRTKAEFAAKYNVAERTLTRWNKLIAERDPLADIREWAKPLHKNVMLSLYNKAIRGGLPEHYKLWIQAMANWRETLNVDQRVITRMEFEVIDKTQ